MDLYLQLNPPARFDNPLVEADLPVFESNATGDSGDEDDDVMKYTRRRRQIWRYDSARTFTLEAEYKQHEGELWKDMNKTIGENGLIWCCNSRQRSNEIIQNVVNAGIWFAYYD